MPDIDGIKLSQLPLGENLANDDLMYAVENGVSKKVEVGYLKNRFVGDLTLADLGDDSTHRLVTDLEKAAWSGKQDALTFDNAPTSGSSNPVKSSGIYTVLGTKANTSDLATVATSGSYADLSNTPTIPDELADLTDDSTHRLVTDTEKSTWNGKQNALTFDDTPTNGSNNPVKSGGVYTALAGKANSSDLATVATSGSYNDLTDTPTIPSDAGDIDYDNTESGLTADDVQGAIDEVNGNIVDVEANPSGTATGNIEKIKVGSTIYDIVGGEPVYGEASGAIASFSDGSANPLVNLKIAINPVQAGSGDPSPSNPRTISGWTGAKVNVCNDNLFDEVWELGVINTTNGENAASTTSIRTKNFIPLKGGTTYNFSWATQSLYMLIFAYKSDKSFSRYISAITANPSNITLTENEEFVRFYTYNNTVEPANMKIEVGTTTTAYEAYNGTTVPVSWQTEAGTVYGGELDVTSGVLTVDRVKITLRNSTTLSFPQSGAIWLLPDDVIVPTQSLAKYVLSSHYKSITQATQDDNSICKTQGNKVIRINDSVNATSLQDYKDYVEAQYNNGTPVEIVYQLAEPVTYQLTPTQVSSILGTNNIWADTGNINYCKYQRDLNICINNIIDQLNS